MPATAHLGAALACSHFAAGLLLISCVEAIGVMTALLTLAAALCSAPVMLLAWLRGCFALMLGLGLAWLRDGSFAAGVLLQHPGCACFTDALGISFAAMTLLLAGFCAAYHALRASRRRDHGLAFTAATPLLLLA